MAGVEDMLVVWGSGAIGGTIGAYLVRAGQDVLFVDADPAHVEAIKADGLKIVGPVDQFVVRAEATTPDKVSGSFRRIALAVKGHHSRAGARALAPHLAADGVVVSLQNGLNREAITAEVGPGRVLLSLVNFAADVIEPGIIHYGGRGRILVGEPDGSQTDRLAEMVSRLRAFDPAVEASDNVTGYLWGKLGYGGILIGTALTNGTMADLLSDPSARLVLGRIAREIMAVARAEGVQPVGVDGFDAAAFIEGNERRIAATFDEMAEHYRHSAKERSGVWRDLAVRKRKTEVDAILGPVSSMAVRHRVPTPTLDRLITFIADIEEGRRDFSQANLQALAA